MLRPIDKHGRKRSELHESERATLRKQKEKAEFLKRNPHYVKNRRG